MISPIFTDDMETRRVERISVACTWRDLEKIREACAIFGWSISSFGRQAMLAHADAILKAANPDHDMHDEEVVE